METHICENCNKSFSTKGNLTNHKKTARFCKQSQNNTDVNHEYKCNFCEKNLTTKHRLKEHHMVCKDKQSFELVQKCENLKEYYEKNLEEKLQEKDEYIFKLEKIILDLQNKLFELASQPQIHKKDLEIPKNISQKMDDLIKDENEIGDNNENKKYISTIKEQEKQLLMKEHRIKRLEEVCLSKKRRVEYPERNVVYILTTDDHLKRRTYIIGKAKNLTTRLGTYNKTCDHTVIYYRECKNEDHMNIVETLVLNKLNDYREQSNRDRFILPENQEIGFFKKIVDDCVEFI